VAQLLSTNVAGTLNVTSNTVTGNLTITQNTITGNLVVLTLMNVVTLNVSQNISNVGNLLVTQNIASNNASFTMNVSTGNLSVTRNITAANITVNSISFIPAWTAATVNNSGTGNGVNAWIGTATGWDTAGFWKNPFGIVTLRGLLSNGAQNVTMSNTTFLNKNVANGFPAPTTNVVISAPFQANGNGAGNVGSTVMKLYNNGALQIVNIATPNGDPLTAALSWNIANISLYNFAYSTL
jgi:hypothetical protein